MGSMNNVAELLRLIENLIRLGAIAEVDHGDPTANPPQPPRVRVKSGALQSGWVPWMNGRAGTTRDWNPPTVGEQCVLFSPGGDTANGFAMPGLFQNAHPAPSNDPALIGRWYPDGTRVEYDHDNHRLLIHCVGDIYLEVEGNLTAKVTGKATVDADSIHHNGGSPVVTTAHICHFTGNPHGDGSSTVTAGK